MNEVEIVVSSTDRSGPGLSAATEKVKKAALESEAAQLRVERAARRAGAAIEKYGQDSLEAREATAGLNRAQFAADQAAGKLAGAQRKAAREVEATGEAADRAGGRLHAFGQVAVTASGKVRSATGVMAKGLAGVALAGGAAAAAALSKGLAGYLDVGAARAKLQAQLGTTAADAARVGRIAGQLYASNYGSSLEEVNAALRSVMQSGAVLEDTSDQQLSAITGDVLNLASTFDQDLGGVTRAVGQMMRTGLARNATEALDIMTRGFQQGADKADDLLDTFNEYPTQFRKLGLTGTQAMGLISQAMRAGARDSDIAADALKEFSIRAVDGSATTAAGFKALGLNAKDMAAQIARGGRSASDGLDTVLDRLRAIPDPVKRSQAAVALFGTQAEDLGAALYAMDASTAVNELGRVGGAAKSMGDALAASPSAKIETLRRQLKTGLTNAVASMITGFQQGSARAHGFAGAMEVTGAAARRVADFFVRNRETVGQFGLAVAQAGALVAGWSLKMTAAVVNFAGQSLHYFGVIVDKFGLVVSALLTGAVKAFGWVPGVGDKLRGARDAVDRWRSGISDGMETASRATLAFAEKTNTAGDAMFTAARKASDLRRHLGDLRDRRLVIEAIDRAKPVADRIQRAIAQVRGKRVTVQVDAGGSIQRIQREINALTGKAISIQVNRVGQGPSGFAHGGITGAAGGGPRSGLTMVGERGIELLELAPGTQVHSNPDTERILAGAGQGWGGGPIHIVLQIGDLTIGEVLLDPMRRIVRNVGGGDVQATFGRTA